MVNTLRQSQGHPTLTLEEAARGGLIDYIAFPTALSGKYQCYTQADLTALRAAGCAVARALARRRTLRRRRR